MTEDEIISKEQFEKEYAEKSGLTIEKVHELGLNAYPCNCDDDKCKGWQMLSDESWEDYKNLHGEAQPPKEEVLK